MTFLRERIVAKQAAVDQLGHWQPCDHCNHTAPLQPWPDTGPTLLLVCERCAQRLDEGEES